jgi:acetylornithine deacetylase/succinyl-diaminopimelate desuccinylase-like protein
VSTLDTAAALKAVDDHFDEFVAELQAFCRIRSRRQEPDQMALAADFVAGSLRRWGGDAEVIPWEHSHPYVLGELPGGPVRLLHFNHYDVEVEPAGDDADWVSAPYAADVRDDCLYARGVADDKGALMSRIYAAAAWRLSGQEPPVTSVFIEEGKQMLHSPGLGSFVAAHADRLKADAALWENSWLDQQGRLLLKLSEKGVLYLRLSVRTLARELTSQNTAILPAATARLVGALGCLLSADGEVLVPGFTDGVRQPSDAEKEMLRGVGFDGDFLKQRAGVSRFKGDLADADAGVAVRVQPTITITGIEGGDLRDDVTLGIPHVAWAKVEIRLVAGQDPDDVLGKIADHLEASGFGDVKIEEMARSRPNMTDPGDPFVELVADTARKTYGTEPVLEPYTIWIGNQGVLSGMPIVGVGVSRADSGIDGANEFVRLEDFRQGIKHVIHVMAAMADAR